jgi:hypothetical protein
MTQSVQSVVTPERFADGLTYQQFIDRLIEEEKAPRTEGADSRPRNVDRFQFNYDNTTVPEEEAKALRALVAKDNGPKKMLVLGEFWCPDVYRGLPVLARIAEASGMELRVFPRDENLDIMNEFLKDGEFQSIPTAVFYTKDHDYILHWIERPRKANDEMPLMRKLYEGRTREEAAPDVAKFQEGPVWAGWRDATITEIRELLEEKVGR